MGEDPSAFIRRHSRLVRALGMSSGELGMSRRALGMSSMTGNVQQGIGNLRPAKETPAGSSDLEL